MPGEKTALTVTDNNTISQDERKLLVGKDQHMYTNIDSTEKMESGQDNKGMGTRLKEGSIGGGTGAVIGGIVGSVIPGPGTAVGILAGSAIGAAIGATKGTGRIGSVLGYITSPLRSNKADTKKNL